MIAGEATNGKEALQLVGGKHPDLVLMDVHMPVMDGLQATEEIKAAWPLVKVVLYSVNPGYEQAARLAGADYFLVKGSPAVTPSDIILSFFPAN